LDATDKEEIRGFVRDAVAEAIAPLAQRVERAEGAIAEVRELQRTFTEEQVKQAQFMTQIAGSAANAADIGLKAMARASDAEDNAAKIVQSAMTIHNASIGATVDATIKSALRERDEVLADIRTSLGIVVKALGHPHLRKALIIAALLGAAVGGGVAGYLGVTGSGAAKQLLP